MHQIADFYPLATCSKQLFGMFCDIPSAWKPLKIQNVMHGEADSQGMVSVSAYPSVELVAKFTVNFKNVLSFSKCQTTKNHIKKAFSELISEAYSGPNF